VAISKTIAAVFHPSKNNQRSAVMFAARLVFALFLGCLFGCGSGSPYKYVKVSGKVTYDDGSIIPNGGMRLRFAAMDAPEVANAAPRPAYARVDDQGGFDCATSYKYGDGLIPGKHKVAIETGGGPDNKIPVPKEYKSISTTPLVVDTADAPFDIKVPKPKK
jgi:hypothetical protein